MPELHEHNWVEIYEHDIWIEEQCVICGEWRTIEEDRYEQDSDEDTNAETEGTSK